MSFQYYGLQNATDSLQFRLAWSERSAEESPLFKSEGKGKKLVPRAGAFSLCSANNFVLLICIHSVGLMVMQLRAFLTRSRVWEQFLHWQSSTSSKDAWHRSTNVFPFPDRAMSSPMWIGKGCKWDHEPFPTQTCPPPCCHRVPHGHTADTHRDPILPSKFEVTAWCGPSWSPT